MTGSTWSCCHLSTSSVYTIHPCTNKAVNRPVGIMSDWQDGRRCQHFVALCGLLTGVLLKGLTLQKLVSDVCVCMFYVCLATGFVDWLDRGFIYIYKKSFEMCIYLWFEFDCPEVTQLLLLLLPSLCFSHSWRSEREDTHASVAVLWAATSSPTILSLEYKM